MIVQLWNRQQRQFLRVSPSKNAKMDPANMRVELHPTASTDSFWRIMPRFKVRSIGDKVRTLDEIVLERATSRGQFAGVSDHAIRTIQKTTESGRTDADDSIPNAFCSPKVHEVSASVQKAAFVLSKYTANNEVQRPRCPASGSVEDAVFNSVKDRKRKDDAEAAAPPICAGDVIQLFHKDSDCWVSAEGVYEDPVDEFGGFGSPDNGLALDIHLRHRRPNIEKPNKSKPPTSAVGYFQVEQAEIYEGGKVGWKSKVRFRHLTSQLYLAAGDKVTGEAGDRGTALIKDGTSASSVFLIHPVIQATAHVPADAYIRIQHAESLNWLHASTIPVKRDGKDFEADALTSSIEEDKPGGGIQKAADVIWDKAGLKELSLSEKQHFSDAFSALLVPEESVYSVAMVAGTIPMLRQYIKRRAERELTPLEATTVTNMLNELHNFLFERKVAIKARQKLLRDLKVIDLLVQVVQAPFNPTAATASDPGENGIAAAQKLKNTGESGLLKYDDVGEHDNRHTMMVMNAAFRVMNACLVGDSRKLELYVSRHIPFLWTMFGTKMSVESLINELIRDNQQIVEMCAKDEVERVVKLLHTPDGKDPNYLEFLSVLCVCEEAPVKRLQGIIGELLLRAGEPPLFNTRVAKGGTGIELTTTGDWDQKKDLYDFAKSALDEKDETSTEEYLFLQRQLELFGNLCKGRNADNIKSITHKELTWEECFVCIQSDYSEESYKIDASRRDPHKMIRKTKVLIADKTTWEAMKVKTRVEILEREEVDLVVPEANYRKKSSKKSYDVVDVALKRLPKSLRRLYVDLIVNLFLDTPAKAGEKANRDVLSEIELTFDWDQLKYTHYTSAAADQTAAMSGAKFVHFPMVKKWIFNVLGSTGAIVHADELVGQPLNKLLASVLNLLWTLIKYGYYADQADIVDLMPVLKSVINGTNDLKVSKHVTETAWNKKQGTMKKIKGTVGPNGPQKSTQRKSTKKTAPRGGAAAGDSAPEHDDVDKDWIKNGRYLTDSEDNKVVVAAKYAALQCVDALFNFVFNVRLRFMMCDFKLAEMLDTKNSHNTQQSISNAESDLKKDDAALKAKFGKGCKTNWDRVTELRQGGGMIELLASMMKKESKTSEIASETKDVRNYLLNLKSKCDWIDPGWELSDGAVGAHAKKSDDLSLVGILLDLAMYEDKLLLVKCLELINRIYSSEYDLCKLAVQAQVLTTKESKALAKHAKEKLPIIKAISRGVLEGEQTETFNTIVDYWTKMCYVESARKDGKTYGVGEWMQPGKPHRVNQTILLNSGVILVLMDVIDTSNQPSSVLRNCFWLLRALCVEYPEVQVKLYESLDAILITESPTMKPGDKEDAAKFEAWENSLGGTISEIFNGCRETCLRVKPEQVETMLECVGRGSPQQTFKSAKLLNALAAVSKVEEWNLPLKRNQELIMKFVWATRTSVVDISAIDEQSDEGINRKRMLLLGNGDIDAKDPLSDPIALAYHSELVFLLASTCEG